MPCVDVTQNAKCAEMALTCGSGVPWCGDPGKSFVRKYRSCASCHSTTTGAQDQNCDSNGHSVHNGGSDRPEYLSETYQAGDELENGPFAALKCGRLPVHAGFLRQ